MKNGQRLTPTKCSRGFQVFGLAVLPRGFNLKGRETEEARVLASRSSQSSSQEKTAKTNQCTDNSVLWGKSISWGKEQFWKVELEDLNHVL